ncbi:Uncharacterized protein FKW44_020350, partial [Caligus rogercresseyi]
MVLVWAHSDFPSGIENMVTDVNAVPYNYKFSGLKNRVHNLLVEHYKPEIPIEEIQSNGKSNLLVKLAKFVSDVSRNYDHKVHPYVKEGSRMIPKVREVSKNLMDLKETKFVDAPWCGDKAKCSKIQRIMSQVKNLEMLWPTQTMFDPLIDQNSDHISHEFMKMTTLAGVIRETVDNFENQVKSLREVTDTNRNGKVRQFITNISMKKVPDSLVNFKQYMQSWATSMFIISLLAMLTFQVAPLVLYLMSAYYAYKYPLGSWQSQKAIKFMSVGTTLILCGSFFLCPIMLMTVYGGAKVDMFSCEILRQPKYEKSIYELSNEYYRTLMYETFSESSQPTIQWDLATEMDLCRKGKPLYKVLHLGQMFKGTPFLRYSDVAQNTIGEFVSSINNKLEMSAKFFDPNYEEELSRFEKVMRALQDSIDLTNAFEDTWSNEIQFPLEQAEQILKELRKDTNSRTGNA